MYYHASKKQGLTVLKPQVSNHRIPLVYLSKKRENVLVYLSNAVEKCCREEGFHYTGPWYTWASYGFDKDGVQRIEEYYPDALRDTYQGVSGYIYTVREVCDGGFQAGIPDAVTSAEPLQTEGSEYIEDAYEAILEAEREGLLRILRYENLPEGMKAWLERTTITEYEEAEDHPDYRFFLERKFGNLLKK